MTLLDKQRLPELETHKDKWTSLLIPIKGTLRIDGETVEKGKSPLMNPTNISNEGDNVAVFMYMVLKADEKVK